MPTKTIRVVMRAANGTLKIKEFESFEQIADLHEQIAIDDCSTDLSLRGMPVFRGLVGPIAESKSAVRYETPEVFETLTKEWSLTKSQRKRRSPSNASQPSNESKPTYIPVPNISLSPTFSTPLVNY